MNHKIISLWLSTVFIMAPLSNGWPANQPIWQTSTLKPIIELKPIDFEPIVHRDPFNPERIIDTPLSGYKMQGYILFGAKARAKLTDPQGVTQWLTLGDKLDGYQLIKISPKSVFFAKEAGPAIEIFNQTV